MSTNKLFYFAFLICILLGMAGSLWAQEAAYNRPNPTMDYVPQEIGIYDTMYYEHAEHNCRKCHGNSTADRHHGVPMVVRDHLCTPCHPTCTVGSPDCENGITIHRDCLTSGCHSWDDVQFGNQRWHHNTDMAGSENCIACHDPNLIEEITPLRDFELYPPTVVSPTPFSCENCHWRQRQLLAGTGPNNPGHPSTYEHSDYWGNLIGYYEYGKPIYGNFDTHHMDFVGSLASECYKCHSIDPDNPSWDPEKPELIRYCEICHSMRTLHTIGPHVQDHSGWKPVGMHTGGGRTFPTTYATWDEDTPYAPQSYPGYTADEQCYGCHGSKVRPYDGPTGCVPNVVSMSPPAGSCNIIVTLRGSCFGPEHIEGRSVQLDLRGDDTPNWIDVPIHAWTDTLIEFRIPCWTFSPGNYNVRVHNEAGNSNQLVFTLADHPTVSSINPTKGPCGVWITINGTGGFQNVQSKMYDSYYGVHHVVDFVASAGTYTATRYRNWNDNQIDVRLYDLFKDQTDTCGVDPYKAGIPRNGRNFVRDRGDENSDSLITCDNTAPAYDECKAEPIIPRCDCLALGTYAIYVKAIYFGDDDASGDLSCGDTIFQIEMSDSAYFELTNMPYINKLNPKQIGLGQILRVYGLNFGPTQGNSDSVRIGSKENAESLTVGLGKEQTDIRLWSNALIKHKVQCSTTWQGTTKYVWVEKGGKKSNYKPLAILTPLP